MSDTIWIVPIFLLSDRSWLCGCRTQRSKGGGDTPGCKARDSILASSTWSNWLIIGYYPAATARRHDLTSLSCRNNIDMLVPVVNNPIKNPSCLYLARCCAGCLVPYKANPFFGRMSHGQMVTALNAVVGRFATDCIAQGPTLPTHEAIRF